MSMKFTGDKEFVSNMRRLGRSSTDEAKLGRVLYVLGETIMTEAKRLTPVDTGALRNTGHVQAPKATPKGVTVTLGYGGPAAPYAVVVHETPPPGGIGSASGLAASKRGFRTARYKVGTWKYLERPFMEYSRKFLKETGIGIERVFRKVVRKPRGS